MLFVYLCGMKHLLWSIVATMAVLVAAVTGCGRAPRYDARLVAIDSLMHDAPDSALALVQAIGTLPAPADRAYRDLLLTQARYRCYVTATSDSDINRALAYYRAHSGEREKLTRAFIYKGAVMDELGHPDSAMLYYKHAEATAAPDDYFNLGYAKMRIATLYQLQVSQDSSAIQRFKESLKYFRLLNDSTHIISVLGSLGAIEGVIDSDSAIQYLNQAIRLAQKVDPSLQYQHMSTLAGVYFYRNDFKSANRLAMYVLNNGAQDCGETQFYHYAAISYIKLGHLDSAKYVFNLIPEPTDAVDSMNYFNTLAEIAEAENNHSLYRLVKERSHDITEEILSNSKKGALAAAESQYDNIVSKKYYEKNNHTIVKISVAILLICVFIIAGMSCFARRILLKRKKENDEMRIELEKALADLKEQAVMNKSVSSLVAHRISAINELYDAIRIKTNEASDKRKSVMPLSGLLKELNEKKQLLEINLSESFWDKMKMSVDGEYNGIVTFVQSQYPELTDNDIKLFCLLCANISPQIIRLCMNYTSDKTSSTYRNRIIQKKMGLDMTFDQFISRYMKGDFNDKN